MCVSFCYVFLWGGFGDFFSVSIRTYLQCTVITFLTGSWYVYITHLTSPLFPPPPFLRSLPFCRRSASLFPFILLFVYILFLVREAMLYLSLCIVFISHNIITSRCIPFPTNDPGSSFMAELHCIVSIQCLPFLHSSVGGHTGHFQGLAAVICAALLPCCLAQIWGSVHAHHMEWPLVLQSSTLCPFTPSLLFLLGFVVIIPGVLT